jgi:acyl-CoA synthetase (NDP forming)
MYIEGPRDGRRLFEVLKRVPLRKPILIWRGGQTAAGSRATASHTASLAQSHEIWEALFRQTGAVRVDGLEEMVDTIKALQWLKPSTGQRFGLITMTGGPSVVLTDTFARVWAGEHLHEIMRILMEDTHIDAVVNDLPLTFLYRRMARQPDFKERLFSTLTEMRARYPKPLLAVVGFSPFEKEEVDMRRELQEIGIPAFHNFERAARAYRNASMYYRFLASVEDAA